jgi:hypothetical protein
VTRNHDVEHLLVTRLVAYAWHLTRVEKIADALGPKPIGEKRDCDATLAMTEEGPARLLRREARLAMTRGVDIGFGAPPLAVGSDSSSPRPSRHLLTVLIRRLKSRMERTFATLQSVRENRHPDIVAQISAELQKTNDAGCKATLSNSTQTSIGGGEAPGASHWLGPKPLLEKVV